MRFVIWIVVLMSMMESVPRVLVARFTPHPGANVEYAQGAIERGELRHREIEPNLWVFVADDGAPPEEWERRLNEALAEPAGRFAVSEADPELRQRVLSGAIALQQ